MEHAGDQMTDLLSLSAFAQLVLNRLRIHARLEDERAREERGAEQATDQNDGEKEKSENGSVSDDGINHCHALRRTKEPEGLYATRPSDSLFSLGRERDCSSRPTKIPSGSWIAK